jgi:hypothetical protein
MIHIQALNLLRMGTVSIIPPIPIQLTWNCHLQIFRKNMWMNWDRIRLIIFGHRVHVMGLRWDIITTLVSKNSESHHQERYLQKHRFGHQRIGFYARLSAMKILTDLSDMAMSATQLWSTKMCPNGILYTARQLHIWQDVTLCTISTTTLRLVTGFVLSSFGAILALIHYHGRISNVTLWEPCLLFGSETLNEKISTNPWR